MYIIFIIFLTRPRETRGTYKIVGIPRVVVDEVTLSLRRPLSYRNQSIDLLCNSMDWFLYNRNLRCNRVNPKMYINSRNKFSHVQYWVELLIGKIYNENFTDEASASEVNSMEERARKKHRLNGG